MISALVCWLRGHNWERWRVGRSAGRGRTVERCARCGEER